MPEMDIQDKTRMQDVYKDITEILDKIGQLSAFPPLVWVWTWDVCVTMLNNFREDSDYVVTMSNEEVWELFWRDSDKNGFTLEYGVEDLDEHISDWLSEAGIVTMVEELEDEDD